MFRRDVLLLLCGLPMRLGLDFDVEQFFRLRLPKSMSRIHTVCSLSSVCFGEHENYSKLESQQRPYLSSARSGGAPVVFCACRAKIASVGATLRATNWQLVHYDAT